MSAPRPRRGRRGEVLDAIDVLRAVLHTGHGRLAAPSPQQLALADQAEAFWEEERERVLAGMRGTLLSADGRDVRRSCARLVALRGTPEEQAEAEQVLEETERNR